MTHVRTWSALIAGFWTAVLVLSTPAADAQGVDPEIENLKTQLEALQRQNAEQQKLIERLVDKVDELEHRGAALPAVPAPARADVTRDEEPEAASAEAALDAALSESEPAAPSPGSDRPEVAARRVGGFAPVSLLSRRLGGMQLRLIDISMDLLAAGGTSTATDREIRSLQGGAHDPRRRGFTLQQAELSLAGAVDPYLGGETHVVFFEDGVELEEAFFTTLQMPYGLQLEGGYFLTEFGLNNPRHAHAWEWIDQPVINSRLFGGDGTRGVGFRLGWLTPLPWFSELHFGMQNANGSFVPSFSAGDGVGGRPAVDRDVHDLGDLLYLLRWNHSWDITPNWIAQLGVSGLYGPNATGPDGETWIYGTDAKLLWRASDNFRGYPYVLLQAEAIKRDYTADGFLAGTEVDGGDDDHGHAHGGEEEEEEEEEDEFPNDLPGDILRDAGLYVQAEYGFRWGWSAGVRYEFAGGSGPSVADGVLVSRQTDSLRDDRHRVSPLLTWRPTEFSRFRLQYNYDHAKHLDGDDAHTVWVGAEVLYGSHAAHRF